MDPASQTGAVGLGSQALVILVALFFAYIIAGQLAGPFGKIVHAIQRCLGMPRNIRTGREVMVGSVVEIVEPIRADVSSDGSNTKVRYRNELWNAYCPPKFVARIETGGNLRARITDIDGLVLVVEPRAASDRAA